MRSSHFISAGLLIVTLLLPGNASAAERIDAFVGEQLTMGAESAFSSASHSWILMEKGRMVMAQSDRFLTHTFERPGTYDLSLTLRAGSQISEHHFVLQVHPETSLGSSRSELTAAIRSVPPADQSGQVRLPGEGGTIKLSFDESGGAITEYRIDANTGVDSDGDGVADNDIENAFHPSLRSGVPFVVSLRSSAGETQRTVRLTVVGEGGEVRDAALTILFDPFLKLTPRMVTFPASSPSSQTIELPSEGGIVRFDASGSYGGVSRFALDLDLSRDSSGDGDPANDNDAAGTVFERDGSSLTMLLRQRGSEQKRHVALVVMNAAGESASLERTIVFAEGGSSARIVSDHEFPAVGQEFTLTVEGSPPGIVQYAWDLQSDGSVNTHTPGPSLSLSPDAPGILPVRVSFLDAAGAMIGSESGEWTVAPQWASAPSGGGIRIDIVSEGLITRFAPVIETPLNLDHLEPTWTFGDGETSYLLEPEHVYREPGSYDVTLTLSDTETGEQIALVNATAVVSGAPVPGRDAGRDGFLAALFAPIIFVFKVVIFVLVVLLLVTAAIFSVIFLQAKRREQSFVDMLRHYKQKITGMGEDPLAEVVDPPAMPKAQLRKQVREADVIDVEGKKGEAKPMKLKTEQKPVATPPPPPPPKPQTPSPSPTPAPPSQAPLSPLRTKEEESLPLWLSQAPKPKQPVPSSPPKPNAEAPAWLKQGMEKAHKEGQTMGASLPKPLQVPAPANPPLPLASQPTLPPPADDETIAIVKAEDVLLSPSDPADEPVEEAEGSVRGAQDNRKKEEPKKEEESDSSDGAGHNVT